MGLIFSPDGNQSDIDNSMTSSMKSSNQRLKQKKKRCYDDVTRRINQSAPVLLPIFDDKVLLLNWPPGDLICIQIWLTDTGTVE